MYFTQCIGILLILLFFTAFLFKQHDTLFKKITIIAMLGQFFIFINGILQILIQYIDMRYSLFDSINKIILLEKICLIFIIFGLIMLIPFIIYIFYKHQKLNIFKVNLFLLIINDIIMVISYTFYLISYYFIHLQNNEKIYRYDNIHIINRYLCVIFLVLSLIFFITLYCRQRKIER